jgi:N-acetylglucosaminyldiphosphoundecaprenol N-acetyl-beta-D-mannosaminyltransferase
MSAIVKPALALPDSQYRRILGLQFFTGTTQQAVELMKGGGLLVVPAAPALKDLPLNHGYREALLAADLTITDSSFMVLLWNIIQRDHIPRVSGLGYLRYLLLQPDVRQPGNTFWIMASPASSDRHREWLNSQGFAISAEDTYCAPLYGETIEDKELLSILCARQPRHIVVTIGGGTQERLGVYLKRQLDYCPAIHCIGAAIGFLSGDQVKIPVWADKLCVGWLFRCLSEPKRYVARYWSARKLLPMILRYRDQLPSSED